MTLLHTTTLVQLVQLVQLLGELIVPMERKAIQVVELLVLVAVLVVEQACLWWGVTPVAADAVQTQALARAAGVATGVASKAISPASAPGVTTSWRVAGDDIV